jgi:hypothetical protein
MGFSEDHELCLGFGAGGALFAAWIAWRAVQRQLALQQRQARIDALTFWQKKYDDAAVAISGLEMVDEVATRCLDILQAVQHPTGTDRYMSHKHPHVEVVRRMKDAGLLDVEQFPRTGSNLIAWHMANYIGRLQIQHQRATAFKGEDPELKKCEGPIRDILELIKQLQSQIHPEHLLTEKVQRMAAKNLDDLGDGW